MMNKQFTIIEQKNLHNGFFKLEQYQLKHTLFNGGWSAPLQRELFFRNDCVGVLLYDPHRDEVVILEQFRVGAMLHNDNAWLLEIVAGGIEEGETAEEVAYREAWEEAGCKIQALTLVSQFYTSPGGASELLSLFCGKVDTAQVGGIHGLIEENEDILVKAIPFSDALKLLAQGQIRSAIPIIAIQWLALNKERLQAQWC